MKRLGKRILLISGLVVLAACTTVPVTGRSSLQIIPGSELTAMSLTQYKQVLDESELSQDPAQVAQVRRVGERLAQATEEFLKAKGYGPSGYEWEFNVIKDDDTVNAWAMPGGKVAVYTGLLPVAQNDEGLATVMGHEIAHVLAGHGNERMSQGLLTQLGGAALSVAVKEQPALTQQIFMGAYGAGTQVGVLLPYSRLHESEADRIGLTLMALAGYDPRAAVPFWERMAAQSKSRPPQLLSTHPAPETRIEDIKRYLPEALAVYRPASGQ
jgi:predicted Zn-dependent protease